MRCTAVVQRSKKESLKKKNNRKVGDTQLSGGRDEIVDSTIVLV